MRKMVGKAWQTGGEVPTGTADENFETKLGRETEIHTVFFGVEMRKRRVM